MRRTGVTDSLEVHTIADIPGEGTGLGSSSSLTVGLLNALYAHRGILKDPAELAEEACQIEIEDLHGTLGKQDQYIAAFGGLRHFEFRPDDTVRTTPIPLAAKEREAFSLHLSLFYTGLTRRAEGILKGQDARTSANHGTLRAMRDPRRRDPRRAARPRLGERRRGHGPGVAVETDPFHRDLESSRSTGSTPGAKAARGVGRQDHRRGGGGFLLLVHPPP